MTLTTNRSGLPKVAFHDVPLYRMFEYYDTLYCKIGPTEAVAVAPGHTETIDREAQVFPVSHIDYALAHA